MTRRIAALTIFALLAVGLVACTAAPDAAPSDTPRPTRTSDAAEGDGQSVDAACALIQDTITEATEEFSDASTEDPAAVVEAMEAAADKLQAAASQISNEDVAAMLPDLQEMFDKTAEVMQGILDGDVSKISELSELSEEFADTSRRFQELCAAG